MQTQSDQIGEIFVRYYSKLLGGKGDGERQQAERTILRDGHILFIEQQLSLMEPTTKKEIKETMFSIKST